MLQDERIYYIDGLIYVYYMRSLSQKLLLKGYRDRSVMVTSRNHDARCRLSEYAEAVAVAGASNYIGNIRCRPDAHAQFKTIYKYGLLLRNEK